MLCLNNSLSGFGIVKLFEEDLKIRELLYKIVGSNLKNESFRRAETPCGTKGDGNTGQNYLSDVSKVANS